MDRNLVVNKPKHQEIQFSGDKIKKEFDKLKKEFQLFAFLEIIDN